MGTRTFTRAELAAYGVPPDNPEDVEHSDILEMDEHVCVLKYSQLRRCVFLADDGRHYRVQYEAQLDTGDYEPGPGPDDHGWHGDSIEAEEVSLELDVIDVPGILARWKPVADFTPDRGRDTSAALTEVRAVLSRAQAARDRLTHPTTRPGDGTSNDADTSHVRYIDPDTADMRTALDHVITLLSQWREAGHNTNIEHKTVWQIPGTGRTHWAWACGGCGYESPFYSPTREDAQYGYSTHRTTCRQPT